MRAAVGPPAYAWRPWDQPENGDLEHFLDLAAAADAAVQLLQQEGQGHRGDQSQGEAAGRELELRDGIWDVRHLGGRDDPDVRLDGRLSLLSLLQAHQEGLVKRAVGRSFALELAQLHLGLLDQGCMPFRFAELFRQRALPAAGNGDLIVEVSDGVLHRMPGPGGHPLLFGLQLEYPGVTFAEFLRQLGLLTHQLELLLPQTEDQRRRQRLGEQIVRVGFALQFTQTLQAYLLRSPLGSDTDECGGQSSQPLASRSVPLAPTSPLAARYF